MDPQEQNSVFQSMSVSAEKYIIKHKNELLKMYSAFFSGLELDIALYENVKVEDMQKRACLLTVLSHKENNYDLDFSFDKNAKITRSDQLLADEFFSVVLCEEHVKIGKLSREGDFYTSDASYDFKSIPKYKKYIRIK